ncbi:3-hydroxyacyl-CoA dehydrogenase [Mesorhizobium sp. M2C.T.Ca.TU.002.02.1.1]|uniref:3-hydroxyacyl-CoA dehydrogenase n=1 Tax=Mesorhizobium sp. M2C.T.Ca.TU.002.02.1.1 TaxID=2496788 RepID=UPI000FCC5391|nr:3-hydroxyacyl-CoA dehydrogenase [Mesorhizobium sp. M2C.T.Ca.TU.002.02.1.1]RUU50014.1 3-hydroxyacyl-CoA dehydrogenase [Mesorhizobium sp. M2C.T.Ca.TU.002.02.1.1]
MEVIRKVAIVGAGLVGRGWAIVFARAGHDVAVYDGSAEIRAAGIESIRASLVDMREAGLVDAIDPVLRRLRVVDTLEAAVAGADYIQESVLERRDVKQAVCLEIDRAMRPDAVVGSSSSGIPASAFTEGCVNRPRFLVAHPVNPPHLIPLVELVPAPWTDAGIVPWLRAQMEQVGQAAIVVRKEVDGFVLNRLQGALLNEAWALLEEGVASAADIDLTVSHGLGYRWSFMGPFETIDLNAPGGIADYARRLGPLYHAIALARRDPAPWSEALIAKAEAERREKLPVSDLSERSVWRDRNLMALVAHKRRIGV